MKTVVLFNDFDYRPHRKITVRFRGGLTYARVIDAAANAIVRAGAGAVIDRHGIVADELGGRPGSGPIDASAAWKPRFGVGHGRSR